MNKVALSVGANCGCKEDNIKNVIFDIEKGVGRVVVISEVYKSDAVGFNSVNKFVNIALLVETEMDSFQLLQEIWDIEKKYGRYKQLIIEQGSERVYQDRTMDIDIIFFNTDIISTKELTIPHIAFYNRAFVLEPLAQIIPTFIDPRTGLSVEELRDNLRKKSL